ncbi:hypothetical protein [Mycobacteroides chelonae]|nr:hypothetical protein [Mycobacteroides chelonae]
MTDDTLSSLNTEQQATEPVEFNSLPASIDADPVMTPEVTAGPITAAVVGNVPIVAVTGKISQYTGLRLAGYVTEAFNALGHSIELPE